jgi:hypothetical protein
LEKILTEFSEIAKKLQISLDEVLSAYSSGMRKLKISMENLRKTDPVCYNSIKRAIMRDETGPYKCHLEIGEQDCPEPDDYESDLEEFYKEFYAD